jgi:hypothetical protein
MKVSEFWQSVYIASIGSHPELADRHTINSKMDEAKILADQAVKDYKNSEFYEKEEESSIESSRNALDIEEELEKIEAKERAEAYEWLKERRKRLFNIISFWRKKA